MTHHTIEVIAAAAAEEVRVSVSRARRAVVSYVQKHWERFPVVEVELRGSRVGQPALLIGLHEPNRYLKDGFFLEEVGERDDVDELPTVRILTEQCDLVRVLCDPEFARDLVLMAEGDVEAPVVTGD